MHNTLEHTIRERAYHLWVADGCREGEADRHWLAAEREVLAASTLTAPTTAAAKRPARRAVPKVAAPAAEAKSGAARIARRRAS